MKKGFKTFILILLLVVLEIAPLEAYLQIFTGNYENSESLRLLILGFAFLGLAFLGRRIAVNNSSSF